MAWQELSGWPRAKWNEGDFEGERKIHVPSSSLSTLLNSLDTGADLQWPYSATGPSSALCRRVLVEPLGQDRNPPTAGTPTSLAEYIDYQVTAWYTTKGPKLLGGILYIEQIVPSQFGFHANPLALEWASDGVALTAQDRVPIMVPSCTVRRKWPKTVTISSWVISDMNKINSAAWSAPLIGVTFPAQKLLLGPPTITSSFTLGKLTTFSVEVDYMYHPANWNHPWRTDTFQFEAAQASGGGAAFVPHSLANFNLHS